jgi:acyl-CoA dehydrogenase
MDMDSLDHFRGEVRTWLAENCPESMRQPVNPGEQYWGGRNASFSSEDARLWFERMRDKGWTAPEWPTEYGGGGLSEAETKVLKEEMKSINARSPIFSIGIWMLGPAILEYGSHEQKQKHITSIVRGESRWCQGYSEPGSGSDLASLQCKAEDMGDHFLVNGSKIWTTKADECDWIFCLVRTDPAAKKQEGISFLLIDMESEGVSTSPIGLISGESEFCQTFFDNVKVPRENLIGDLNQGWSVAKSLLKHERKLMSEMGSDIPAVEPRAMLAEHVEMRDGKIADPELRRQMVEYDMFMHALGLTHFRGFEERLRGVSGDSALIMKYVGTEAEVLKGELLLALLGSEGLGWEGEEFSDEGLRALRQWAMSKALTIAGGTSEIQLNIIAKRALGLPQS